MKTYQHQVADEVERALALLRDLLAALETHNHEDVNLVSHHLLRDLLAHAQVAQQAEGYVLHAHTDATRASHVHISENEELPRGEEKSVEVDVIHELMIGLQRLQITASHSNNARHLVHDLNNHGVLLVGHALVQLLHSLLVTPLFLSHVLDQTTLPEPSHASQLLLAARLLLLLLHTRLLVART